MRSKGLIQILTILVGMSSFSGAQKTGPTPAPAASLPPSAVYAKLPLTFEANRGQAAPQVNFVSRGKGYTAVLTAGGLILSLRSNSAAGEPSALQSDSNATLQFNLVGASKNPMAVGEDHQPGIVNYFVGNNPRNWRTKIQTYARVRYKNVYPGIDLIYYGNHQQLEYDFSVAPGADPTQIQFQIQGADDLQLDSEGNLNLTIGTRNVNFRSPVIYQESNGNRVPVDGGYFLKDSTHLGFQLRHYDASKPVVIDPVLVYSTYLGGSGADQATGIAVDGSGNVYVTGYTDSTDFPLTTIGTPAANTDHIFVAKLDATGANLLYADYIGGNGDDYGMALVLDGSNNVYVTGMTESSNFPVVNPFQGQQPGPYSGFLTKVSADGSSLVYSTYLGGSTYDEPTGLAIDGLGQAHVAGYTMSQNFPVANAYQSTASPNQAGYYGSYGFVTKFSADGSALVYSTFFGGNSNVALNCGYPCYPSPYNSISGIAVDNSDSAYVTGSTNTYNFPTTSGAYLASDTLQQDENAAFVSKFGSSGSLSYSTYFYAQSTSPVTPNAIAVDGSGSAYITGVALSDGTFPITSTSICDPSSSGYACGFAFVTKFDAAGATLMYSTFLGPNNSATPFSIALDANDDAFVVSSTNSDTYTTTNAIEGYAGGADVLLVEIDPLATTQLMSTYLGGSGDEQPAGIAVDAQGNVYVTGSTTSSDFPTTPGAFQTIPGGNTDAFIAKIGAASAPAVSTTPSSLQFAALQVGTTSQAQSVLVRNMGNAPLTITSISSNGDFAQTNNCGNSISAAGSCTLSMTFTPTAAGTRSGSVVIQDDAAGSPHQINLTGVGSGPGISFSPASLSFASAAVGTSSGSQTVTLTNNGTVTLQISNIQISGDYSETNTCPSSLAAGANCTINVTFTPTLSGTRGGSLTVNDNSPDSLQSVSLSGTGADFSLTASPTQNTVKSGSSATYTINATPVGGAFGNSVSLSCSGLPANASCAFSPASPTPGANGTSSTLTISTTSSSSQNSAPFSSHGRPMVAFWMQMQGFGLFGMVLAGSKRNRKKAAIFILLALLVLGMLFMSGCAGGTGIAQQSGGSGNGSGTSYNITVTGTSGALQHSITISLTVQ
jgi:Beta-propeller repeat/Abnormal spindle-like microcephaly-assoc'd, ASPM-SPD-2-Hydin